jgi:D-sedoheptulose 7-phosphate isomerase
VFLACFVVIRYQSDILTRKQFRSSRGMDEGIERLGKDILAIMDDRTHVERTFGLLCHALSELNIDTIMKAGALIAKSVREGNQLLVAGNGGSAATASHFASDLVNRGSFLTKRPIRAVCLNDNIPLVTALTNDIGWPQVYKYQLERLSKPGDIFVAISVNGGLSFRNGIEHSQNLVCALEAARSLDCPTIGLTGNGGGVFGDLCTVCISVCSREPAVAEPISSVMTHLLIESIVSLLAKASTEQQPAII